MSLQLNLFEHQIAEHSFFAIDNKRDFVVYNSHENLNNDEVLSDDIIEIKIIDKIINKLKSEVWSCNCKFFFIIQPNGIYLQSVYSKHGWFCKKKSKKFIEMYINGKPD